MTDRELIERAARACGIGGEWVDGIGFIHISVDGDRGAWWRPLDDDGDALAATRRAITMAAAQIKEAQA